jgi:aminomethyltransferase
VTGARRTPLDAAHLEAGGRFIEFAGWRLPVHYGSILAEARAVREEAGMFDVSHMGRVRVRGAAALDVFRRLSTNDLGRVAPGRAQYTAWCTPDGGTIDDLIVFWLSDDEFLVVFNASRHDDDFAHLEDHAAAVTLLDETDATSMIAVQGPQAIAIVKELGAARAAELPRFGVVRDEIAGVGAIVARTGYTGEDGVELIVEAGAGPRVWEALRARGVVPSGLGARDALRMEMGFPLYGHELGLDISPLEAGLSFAVAFDDHDFIGRDALVKQKGEGPPRRLVGFVCSKPAVPQSGDEVGPGVVTSGGTSVVLNAPIGLAFVPKDASTGPATLRTRGKEIPVELRSLPLIERGRPKKRKKAS